MYTSDGLSTLQFKLYVNWQSTALSHTFITEKPCNPWLSLSPCLSVSSCVCVCLSINVGFCMSVCLSIASYSARRAF